ncbi:MAG: SCO family protein [Magnetovibrio sp.]|nr:SCO family protein [Magnetovibrio sp.]
MMDEKSKVSEKKKTTNRKNVKSKAPEKSEKKDLPKSLVVWLSVVFILSGTLLIAGYNILIAPSPMLESKKNSNQGMDIGGPFTAISHNGYAVTEKDFLGKFLLVYFGYTYCPDVCPTGLTEISTAIDMIGGEADSVVPIFVTVDPERDTPEYLKEYISYFHPRMVGLSGTMKQISKIAKAYKVYFSKGDQASAGPDDYIINHSAFAYLMGKDGKYLTHFSYGVSAEEIARRVREYL